MKKNSFSFRKDNSGYSFLFVVIGVIFLIAIGAISLTMATSYFMTTTVSKHSSEQFYTTESIVQEIKTGIQESANIKSENAYKEVLETFASVPTQTRDDRYAVMFLRELADSLVGTGVTWDGTTNGVEFVCSLDKIKALTTKPDAVSIAPGKGAIKVVLYNKTCLEKKFHLEVKNLYVNYTDDDGYNSSIKTDIVINVPEYHLGADSTINEIKNYIVITDNKLVVSNSGQHLANMAALLRGNIYAGFLDTNNKSSILVANDLGGSQAIFNSDRIIARGDLEVAHGSDLQIRNREGASGGDLWALDLLLSKTQAYANSKKSTKLDMDNNSFIQNDMIINASRSQVTMKGSYYGYSFNYANTQVTDPSKLKASYSSAVLVNGARTELYTNGLKKMVLAGRSFIEKKNSNLVGISSDIQMGESFAVKGNQVAYLVPTEYIDKKMNPVIDGEEGHVLKDDLLASPIGTYLDQTNPSTENHYSNTMTYFFLKFKDEKSANDYFKEYYYSDEDLNTVVKDSEKTYIVSWNDPTTLKFDASLYLLAGNIVKYNEVQDKTEVQESEYFDNNGKPSQTLLDMGIAKGKEFVSRQLSLLAASNTTAMRLEDEASNDPLVAKKIVDFSKISGTIRRSYTDLGDIVFVDGNTSVSSATNKGIIVATGNVRVDTNFTGLILAGGEVMVEGKVNAINDIVLVKSILKNVEQDKDIRDIFYEIDKLDAKSVTKVSLADYVAYKNWSKNDD